MAGKIFISYRREDEQSFAVRLYERLVDGFGKERLFFDVDSIPPGFDFVRYIEDQIRLSEIVLVVIGRDWLDAKDAHGRRRLDNPEDFVRIEIEAALKQDKHVIPVLVQGAPMPLSTQLPRNMKPLARRNAFFATHVGFRAEAERLINGINNALVHLDARRNEETERREADARNADAARREAARQADENAKRALAAAAKELMVHDAAEQERLKREELQNATAAAEARRDAEEAATERERVSQLKGARDAELLAEQAKRAAEEERIAEARTQLRIAEAKAAEEAQSEVARQAEKEIMPAAETAQRQGEQGSWTPADAADARRAAEAAAERDTTALLDLGRDKVFPTEDEREAANEEKVAEARRQLRLAEAKVAEAAVRPVETIVDTENPAGWIVVDEEIRKRGLSREHSGRTPPDPYDPVADHRLNQRGARVPTVWGFSMPVVVGLGLGVWILLALLIASTPGTRNLTGGGLVGTLALTAVVMALGLGVLRMLRDR